MKCLKSAIRKTAKGVRRVSVSRQRAPEPGSSHKDGPLWRPNPIKVMGPSSPASIRSIDSNGPTLVVTHQAKQQEFSQYCLHFRWVSNKIKVSWNPHPTPATFPSSKGQVKKPSMVLLPYLSYSI